MPIRLRLKGRAGASNITLDNDDTTVSELRALAAESHGLSPTATILKFGYPPRVTRTELVRDALQGRTAGGEQVLVEEETAPQTPSPPPPTPPGAAATSAAAAASPAVQASLPKAFAKNSQVEYRDASGNWVGATVVSVAYDDELVPYYEITLNADGRGKSTVGERLRSAPAGQAPPPPPPDPQALATLTSMGFDELTAKTALDQTGDNVEHAVEWVFANGPVAQGEGISASATASHAAAPASATVGVGATAGGIMVRRPVPADNSCMFTSLLWLFEGRRDKSEATNLRYVCQRRIEAEPATYTAAVLGRAPSSYGNWLLQPDSWGGEIELTVLCHHFGSEIVVADIQTLRPMVYGEGSGYGRRVFLIFDGAHYDPLAMAVSGSDDAAGAAAEDESNDVRVFPSPHVDPAAAAVILQKALKVAREAQSARQYTNLATDTIRCMTCQKTMAGQEEAVAHAKATGHTNFGAI